MYGLKWYSANFIVTLNMLLLPSNIGCVSILISIVSSIMLFHVIAVCVSLNKIFAVNTWRDIYCTPFDQFDFESTHQQFISRTEFKNSNWTENAIDWMRTSKQNYRHVFSGKLYVRRTESNLALRFIVFYIFDVILTLKFFFFLDTNRLLW